MSSHTYRPQSPDLSSYAPRSPNLSNTYRPQSPDLSGLGQPSAQPPPPVHSSYPINNIPPPVFADHTYQGPTTAFSPASVPAIPPPFPQAQYGHPPVPYSMPPRRQIKEEDEEYMPDAFAQHSGHQQYPLMPANGNPMAFSPAHNQMVKTEAPQDPTHGVALKTSFPVARIKRIMQADEDIGKVAQVTPHVVSRALELFMIKLITASADHARGGPAAAGGSAAGASKGPKRVLAQHLKRAIQADETFDFLADIIAKVPDAPASKSKKEPTSDSEEAKPKGGARKGRKRKDSGDDM